MTTARKTRTKKPKSQEQASTIATVTPPQVGPVVVDGLLHFSPYDLMRFELAQHKVANAFQASRLKGAELEGLARRFEDERRRLEAERVALAQAASGLEEDLAALRKELEALYQLDLTKVVYDNATGKLMVMHEGEAKPVPVPVGDKLGQSG